MKDQDQYNFKDLIDHFEGNEEVQAKLIRVRLQDHAVRFREVCDDTLAKVLDGSFIWDLTEEGFGYWSNLSGKLRLLGYKRNNFKYPSNDLTNHDRRKSLQI